MVKGDVSSPPEGNLRIFDYLYAIETALRELIIDALSSNAGPRWYRNRLSKDVYEKYLDGLKYSRSIRWTELLPHHPIYYVDFADLKKTIIQKDNWRDTFEQFFGDKALIERLLTDLELPRNTIAHNRKASDIEDKTVTANFERIRQLIGVTRFTNLSLMCTTAIDITSHLKVLLAEAELAHKTCLEMSPAIPLKSWPNISSQWWYDDSFLSDTLKPIDEFFETVGRYSSLDRSRGTGHIIEAWVKEQGLEKKFQQARDVLLSLISKGV